VRRNLVLWSTGLVLLLGPPLTGCMSWRVESAAPAELVARDHPSKIRVQHASGQWHVLRWPEVHGDSLRESGRPTGRTPRQAIALADATLVATRHFSAGKTAGLGLGVVAAVGTAALIALASWDGPFGSCCQ
jgi:hypothetical protein